MAIACRLDCSFHSRRRDGSIRTDVVLRNEQGHIIAIYDVKTGNATMAPAKEAKIRAYTCVGREVPLIILHAVRGVGSP